MSNNNGVHRRHRPSLIGWQELFDPKTQRAYFHNPKTGEVSWEHPTHKQSPNKKKKTPKEKKQPRTINATYKALRSVKSVEGLPDSQFTPKEVQFFLKCRN